MSAENQGKLICDVTQSWSATGGGIGTYLRRKARYIADHTDHRHLLIVPGAEDVVVSEGRLTRIELKSPSLPHQKNYRLLVRNKAVRKVFDEYAPDLIETQDPYNLPWAALKYREQHPQTAVIGGYHTDFARTHFADVFGKHLGKRIGRFAERRAERYAAKLYKQFDHVYVLSRSAKRLLENMGVDDPDIMPLGVDLTDFDPSLRDMEYRRSLGVADDAPLLVYAGRLDNEKRAHIVLEAFLKLPEELGAHLVIFGHGPLLNRMNKEGTPPRVHMAGFVKDRREMGRAFASADIYTSAMPFETFGMSVIEAQACGLPVVGVAAGAMPDRVPPGTGLLGPKDDADAMAQNILRMWESDHRAMGERGRQLSSQSFSWDNTFETLFDTIYPRAFAKRDARLAKSGWTPTEDAQTKAA